MLSGLNTDTAKLETTSTRLAKKEAAKGCQLTPLSERSSQQLLLADEVIYPSLWNRCAAGSDQGTHDNSPVAVVTTEVCAGDERGLEVV